MFRGMYLLSVNEGIRKMKGEFRPVPGLEKTLWRWFYFGLIACSGVELIQLAVGLVSGREYGSLYYLYRFKLVYLFYPSFGMCLCLIMMARSNWEGIDRLFIPFGSVLYCQGVVTIYSWHTGAAVLILDLVGASVNLIVFFLFTVVIFVTALFSLRYRVTQKKTSGGNRGVQSKLSEVVFGCSPSRRIQGAWPRFLPEIISVALIMDSISVLWQASPRWLTLKFDDYLLTSVYIYGREFFIPVILNTIAVVLILRGWNNVVFWLPYLLIFLSHRAFFPAWEEWLPTPIYILWADRALVVLILVNTVWSFLNWLKLRGGLPKDNV